MIFFTILGDNGLIWIILIVALLILKTKRKAGLTMIFFLIIIMILNNYLKVTFNRIRPYEYFSFLPKVKTSGTASFPSAHTSIAFGILTLCNFYKFKYRNIIFITAFMIGISRFYLEVHYFTDVAAGALLGTGVAYGVIYLNYYINKILLSEQAYRLKHHFIKIKKHI